MIIRNIAEEDFIGIDSISKFKLDDVDKDTSLVMIDDSNRLLSYIIMAKEDICPYEISEEDTICQKVMNVFVCDENPFGDIMNCLKRLF